VLSFSERFSGRVLAKTPFPQLLVPLKQNTSAALLHHCKSLQLIAFSVNDKRLPPVDPTVTSVLSFSERFSGRVLAKTPFLNYLSLETKHQCCIAASL